MKKESLLLLIVLLLISGSMAFAQFGAGLPLKTPVTRFEKANGLIGTPSVVFQGDTLGIISARGHDGTEFSAGAEIYFLVTGPVRKDTVPTSIIFQTAGVDNLSIDTCGYVGIGTINPETVLDIYAPCKDSNNMITQRVCTGMFSRSGLVCYPNGIYRIENSINYDNQTNLRLAPNSGAWQSTFRIDEFDPADPNSPNGRGAFIIYSAAPGSGQVVWDEWFILDDSGYVQIPALAPGGNLRVNTAGRIEVGTADDNDWGLTPTTLTSDREVIISTQGLNIGAQLTVFSDTSNAIYGYTYNENRAGVVGDYQNVTGVPLDGRGVKGMADDEDASGYGGDFKGGKVGARGIVNPLGGSLPLDYYGIQGIADGGTNIAGSGQINIGLYGYADGADQIQDGGAFTGDWAVYADGEAFSTVSWTASDSALKKDVEPITKGLEVVMQLSPRSYEFISGTPINLPGGRHVGFFAQEIERLIPQAVTTTRSPQVDREWESGEKSREPEFTFKAVNYQALLPFMVKATQEQQALIRTQEDRIESQASEIQVLKESLLSLAERLERLESGETLHPSPQPQSGSRLFQNIPNPASGITEIPFFLASNPENAAIRIVEAGSGKLIQTLRITGQGFGTVKASLDGLAGGVYVYQLLVDGELVESLRLIKY